MRGAYYNQRIEDKFAAYNAYNVRKVSRGEKRKIEKTPLIDACNAKGQYMQLVWTNIHRSFIITTSLKGASPKITLPHTSLHSLTRPPYLVKSPSQSIIHPHSPLLNLTQPHPTASNHIQQHLTLSNLIKHHQNFPISSNFT